MRVLLALTLLLALPAATRAETPIDARAFVDSQGVNTHLSYTDTLYNDYPAVKAKLRELGIRHIRDGMDASRRQFFYDRVNDLAADGIKSTLIGCDFPNSTDWRHYADAAKLEIPDALDALEGVNEPHLAGGGTHDGGEWWYDARGCSYWLRELARRDGWNGPPLTVPVYGPSAPPEPLGSLWEPRHADGGSIHPYPGNERPSGPGYYPFWKQAQDSRDLSFAGLGVPVVATETGYHNAVNHTGGHKPVSEKASGIYVPRLLLEYARAGIERTFLYELVDVKADATKSNAQRHFGLYRNDWSAKPAAVAIKHMNAWLDGPAGPRTPLDVKLTNTADPDGAGSRGDVRHLLMQKADASYWLAVWQNSVVWHPSKAVDISNAAASAHVGLPRSMSVACYRPATGGTCGSLSSTTGFDVAVPDDILLLRLGER